MGFDSDWLLLDGYIIQMAVLAVGGHSVGNGSDIDLRPYDIAVFEPGVNSYA